MTQLRTPLLAELYESDETAWLDEMARLASLGAVADLDTAHLAEYLTDMATCDRRAGEVRLEVLVAHLLKWQFQLSKRSRSWQLTIAAQRQSLRRQLTSRTLRNHAADGLAEVYADAVELATIETGLPANDFPATCPYTLEEALEESELEEFPQSDE